MSNGFKMTNSLELQICPDEEKARFILEQNFGWYPSALCIANREDAIIHKNWFMDVYNVPTISVHYCKNSTENNNWCKSKDEIDHFLRNRATFFVHMVTYVQEDVYPGHRAVNFYPHNGDEDKYFPTVTSYGSIKYGSYDIEKETRDSKMFVDEINVHFSQIRIQDDPWERGWLQRSTSFLNLEWNRDLQDSIYNGYDWSESGSEPEDFIRIYISGLDNVGYSYDR